MLVAHTTLLKSHVAAQAYINKLSVQLIIFYHADYTNSGVAIITQPDPQRAFVKYFPSVDEQRQYSEEGFAGQFVVRYDIDRELDAGDVLVSGLTQVTG